MQDRQAFRELDGGRIERVLADDIRRILAQSSEEAPEGAVEGLEGVLLDLAAGTDSSGRGCGLGGDLDDGKVVDG